MRISDWSSDVCSSDLADQRIRTIGLRGARRDARRQQVRAAGAEALGDPRIDGDGVGDLVTGRSRPGADIFRRGRFKWRRRERAGSALIGELGGTAVATTERPVKTRTDMGGRFRKGTILLIGRSGDNVEEERTITKRRR